ncbi:MAG: hypothetical protein AAB483_00485 [Patescibacteria group bacterium]
MPLIKRRSLSKIYKIFVGLAIVVVIAGAGIGFAMSRELQFFGLQFFARPTMLDKIQTGIAMLKASPRLEYTEGVKHQTALAILNVKTGELMERRIWITPDGTLLSSEDPKIDVVIKWSNVFNSVYEIRGNSDLVVVANKFLIERKFLPEQKTLQLAEDAPKSRYTDMVYAPYSELLRTPETIAAGTAYLNVRAEEAYRDLRARKVMSLAYPGKLAADVVPPDLAKNIILTEQVDPGWLTLSEDGGKALAERTLAIIGANGAWAYRYINSKAGARGLAQFIEPTYFGMIDYYPNAGLIKDHQLGMTDHTNAFKAIILFFDLHEAELRGKIQRADVPITKAMLAAAYNGGPNRVIQSVNRYGAGWEQSNIFHDETSTYIKKYHLLEALKIF